jgi:hypothetical protein
LANNNTSTDAVDIGFYGKYTPSGTTLYSGLFREALTGKYRLFKGLEDEPTTTVNTGGTGYAVATLVASLEGNVIGNVVGNLSGNVTGGSISGTTGLFTDNVNIAGTLVIDDELTIEGSAFGRIEIGGASGGYIDLKAPHTDDYDLRIITSSGGNEITTATGDLIFNTAETLALTIDTSQDATFVGGVTASSFSGNLTGNVTGNVTGDLTGNVTATSVLADGVTATTQSDGDNSTKVATTAYVDTAIEGHDTLAEVLAGGNTTGGTDIAVSANDDITFADNSKIILGAGSDLEIYSDGTDNYITQSSGTDLIFTIESSEMIRIQSGGDISISESNPGNASRFYVNGFGYSTAAWAVGTSTGTFVGQITSSGNKLQIKSEENNDIQIGDATSLNIIHIDTSEDSVGINTANPSSYTKHELVVTAPDEGGVTIASGTDEAAYLAFADSTTSPVHFIRVDHDTDAFQLHSRSTFSFQILEGVEVLGLNDVGGGTAIFAGNVGITGKTPAYGLNLAQGTGSGNKIAWTDGAPNFAASIYANSSTDKLTFATKNASNVETTALEIDISQNSTFAGNVKIGSSTTGTPALNADDLVIDKGASESGITLISTAAATIRFGDAANTSIGSVEYNHNSNYMRFSTNNAERMRIDSSGNVGIGVSSLQSWARLQVAGTAGAQTGANQALYVTAPSTTAGEGVGIRLSAASGSNEAVGIIGMVNNASGNAGSMTFHTYNGGADIPERMRIDNSGNVGIGTTTPGQKLEVIGNISSGLSSTTTRTALIANTFGYSTSWKTLTLGSAGTNYQTDAVSLCFNVLLNQNSSGLYSGDGSEYFWRNTGSFKTPNSGNNGYNTILSWNSSGQPYFSNNVGIGTTSPDITGFGYKTLTVVGGTSAGYAGVLELGSPTTNANGQNLGIIAFMDGSTRNAQIDVTRASSTSTSNMHFYTNGGSGIVERMRITQPGALIVTTDSPNGSTGVFYNNSSTTPYGVACSLPNGSVDNTRYLFFGDCAGSSKFKVSTSGQIYAVSTSIASISDIRFKENIRDIDTGLEEILKLKPRLFDWKENKGKNEKDSVGFIAQEVEEVLPKLVQKNWLDNGINEDGSAIEGEKYKTVSQADMIPTLVKAIQELKAEIEELKTQINN